MKAIEQYFPVVLFIMLYKVVLTFESVYEILKRDRSSERYGAVLSSAVVSFSLFRKIKFLSFFQIHLEYSRGLYKELLFARKRSCKS